MKMSTEKYLKMYSAVYSRPKIAKLLQTLYTVITFLTIATYGWVIGYNVVKDFMLTVYLLVVTAIPFIAVTVVRKLINAPRPYEVFDCDELIAVRVSGKSGLSFPSRHSTSIFLIGSAFTFVIPWVGITILCLGVVLAVSRFLLGIHFLRDVIAGAIIGSVAGVIGMLIVNFFLR